MPMNRITSFNTIRALRELFSRFCIPKTIVSDNGSNFTSKEVKQFLDSNKIRQKLTSPAHLSTNGPAERFVQTLKNGLRSAVNHSGDMHTKLHRLLMQYRKTQSSTTGKSPAEMMLKFNLRTRLDLMREANTDHARDLGDCKRSVGVGDRVQVRFYQNKESKWKFGRVAKRDGYLHYIVDIDGVSYRRHIDQIRCTNVEGNTSSELVSKFIPTDTQLPTVINKEIPEKSNLSLENTVTSNDKTTEIPQNMNDTSNMEAVLSPLPSGSIEESGKLAGLPDQPKDSDQVVEARRSTRIRRPVVLYQHKP
ncbi:uncharacterized protein K02A2.6-like [Eupeodes corollae]|uniref:uncharacterized protein K02A2.6-like n=1 Tax=Eupeodes corollae TaxID=290404 RepID=UPI0024934026|nr:uncharacterized protein K02A2.6-like [Eupeodes corollae]